MLPSPQDQWALVTGCRDQQDAEVVLYRTAQKKTFPLTAEGMEGFVYQHRAARWASLELAAVPRIVGTNQAARSSLLWVTGSGGKFVDALGRFQVRPTLVLRTGKSLHARALWAVTELMGFDETRLLNRRLARALGGSMKDASPDVFMFSVPGSRVMRDRVKPVEVVVAEWRPENLLPADEVAGWLPDAPEKRQYKAAA